MDIDIDIDIDINYLLTTELLSDASPGDTPSPEIATRAALACLIKSVCNQAATEMETPNNPDDYFMIINKPDDTARHPFMYNDFKDVVDRVISTDGITDGLPDSRKKPFSMLVVGMGRGKTRMLMELSQELNKREGVLAIPITFNKNWNSELSDDLEDQFSTRAAINYAMSIATRVISMHYRVTHTDVVDSFLSRTKSAKITAKPNEIIEETVKAIVNEVQNRTGGSANFKLKQFVLLVDEAKRAENRFGSGKHNILRNALLDTELLSGLDIRLVMASLDISSSGVSDSGRLIDTLNVVDALPLGRVLDEWLVPHVNRRVPSDKPFEVLNGKDRLVVLSLIAVMARLPRAVEYLIFAVTIAFSKSVSTGQPLVFDKATVDQLFQNALQNIRILYPSMNNPPPLKYIKALLFGEWIRVDDVVMDLVRWSQYTNAVKDLLPDGKTIIIPETSAISMYLMKDVTKKYGEALRDTVDDLNGYMLGRAGTIYSSGYPLEVIARGLVNVRLGVLVDIVADETDTYVESAGCQLRSLLRVAVVNVPGDVGVVDLLQTDLKFSRDRKRVGKTSMIPCSYMRECKPPQGKLLLSICDASLILSRLAHH